MPNDSWSPKNSLRKKPRSYTYGDSSAYNAQDETNGLPFRFWRETIGLCGSANQRITSSPTEYTEQEAYRQTVLWTRAVARYTNRLVLVGIVAAGVSAFQWYELRSGGADTHALAEAAKTQAEEAKESIVASQRAWIGPINASMEQPITKQPMKATVFYQNSGKQPSPLTITVAFEVFAKDDFYGFLFHNYLVSMKNFCISNVDFSQNGIAFPAVASLSAGQYTITINSVTEGETSKKILADQEIVDGQSVVVLTGCLTYQTYQKIRHSFFCYFYRSKITDNIANLNICPKTGYAD